MNFDQYVSENNLIEPEEGIVVAVSGGADSICLLLQLMEYARKNRNTLYVAHVNHGLRPEAEGEARYVEMLCKMFGLPFFLREEDVAAKSRDWKVSTEEAGRRVRYEFFETVRVQTKASKIAVAHHRGDRAETILYHLFRGTGPEGLLGIRPKREKIIRPILWMTREQIEEYVHASGLGYCEDASNDSDDYTRNRIRHHIVKVAEKEVNAQAVSHINACADLLEEAFAELDLLTKEAYETYVTEEKGAIRIREGLAGRPYISKEVLRRAFVSLSGTRKDITQTHLTDVHALWDKQPGKRVMLPYGMVASRTYDGIRITAADSAEADAGAQTEGFAARLDKELLSESEEYVVELPGASGAKLVLRRLSYDGTEIAQNQYTKWLDYDKIDKWLAVRVPEPEDWIAVRTGNPPTLHQKSLKEVMKNEKVPSEERGRRILLCEGNHVLWFVGSRISEQVKVDQNTKRILQAELVLPADGERN